VLNKSIRKDKLSKDAIDVITYAFSIGVMADQLPVPVNAVEVKIGNDEVKSILDGGDNFVKHSLSKSEHYFKHIDDNDWAIIVDTDCDGDVTNGKLIVGEYYDQEV